MNPMSLMNSLRRSLPLAALLLGLLWMLPMVTAEAASVQAGQDGSFSLKFGDQGDQLDVTVVGGQNHKGALILWFTNQYGDVTGPQAIAHALARRGATVWMVDLLDSLMLRRANKVVRGMSGDSVKALIAHGVASGRKVTVMGIDRMAVPILRGLRAWQAKAKDPDRVSGAVLLFPNLYRGTPVAGKTPQYMGIVHATNMPVMVLEPQYGVYRNHLGKLLTALQDAGSCTFGWIIHDVRDYFPLHLKTPQNKTLANLKHYMKPAEARAMQALPGQILESIDVMSKARHPSKVLPVKTALEKPTQQRFGLVKLKPHPAPDFALPDLRGHIHRLQHDRHGVTLVNFWASWCPHCIQEIPSMNELAKSYPNHQLRVLSINFKESRSHVDQFMQRFDVSFPVLIDRNGDVASKWGVFAFPSSFLVDPQGRIRYSVNSSIDWNTPKVRKIIDGLLKKPHKGGK